MSVASEQLGAFVKKSPIGVGCAVLSLALIVTAYVRWDYRADEKTKLDEKSTESARLTANLKNAAQLPEQFDAVMAAEKAIENRLIRASQLTTNNQYFYKLESDTGVKLLNLQPVAISAAQKKDAGKSGYIPIAFGVSVQGNYTQLLQFLRNLENGQHYCRVLAASCNAPPDRDSALTLALNIELLGLP
jgi:hypothetical protein